MTQPIGPTYVGTAWVQRLASLVHEIRPDWDEPGIRSALSRVADRPLIDVTAAAVAACRRIDQRSPGIIALDGQHWPTGQQAQRTYTESGLLTRCEHNIIGARCPDCYPRDRHGVVPTTEQRAQMRAAIQQAKENR